MSVIIYTSGYFQQPFLIKLKMLFHSLIHFQQERGVATKAPKTL
jgi:hypothetical protein